MTDFKTSQTYLNSARAFAGECQAGMRYQLMAEIAVKEGLFKLSDLIRNIAKNETSHATIFFNGMIENGGNAENVMIEAGYPFRGGSLEECLAFAARDEENEETRIYPEFARIAAEEGYDKIACAFRNIAQIEGNHKIIFSYLSEAVKSGTLYKNDSPVLWICGECGYMHTAKEAFEKCPVCRKDRGYVELHLPFDYFGKNGMSLFADKKGEKHEKS